MNHLSALNEREISRIAEAAVKTARPQHKRFAFKTPLALALEQLIVNQQIAVMHITDAPPREPDGGYIRIAHRLERARAQASISLALAGADITDSASMISRMAWLAGRQSGKTEQTLTAMSALEDYAGGNQAPDSPSGTVAV